jgi:hypothetical protein
MRVGYSQVLYRLSPVLILIFVFSIKYSFGLAVVSNDIYEAKSANKLELIFSHERNFYESAFELFITSSNSDATIFYTFDGSTPTSENGIKYNREIYIDSTIVLKAISISANDTSKVYTHSYIFPLTSAKQVKLPAGFPKIWRGSSKIRADYEMDPEIIEQFVSDSKIIGAFKSLPVLSLSMHTDNWFDHSKGLYVGYPNSSESREKAVTAEFIFNTNEENFAVECGVQNQGGTSIINWMVPKQSMRLLFKDIYGPKKLKRKFFPDSEIKSINTLVVDGYLNTWLHPWFEEQRKSSILIRDQLTSDMHNAMGGLSFHGRFVHLFLNGLYWGIYDLHERPDDAFLSEYMDAKREDFDIIKQSPKRIVQGSNKPYLEMLDVARNGLSTDKGFETIQKYLDLPQFIDYIILNFYLGNHDWAHHNYYAARNKKKKTGFRFYTWDSEDVMRNSNVSYNNTLKNDKNGPTEIHTLLKENEKYRLMFADAVYKHCYNDGTLIPENFEKIFLARKNEIEDAVVLESARWGDFRKDKSGVTYTKKYWDIEINKILTEYIPNRRDIFVKQLQNKDNRLFPEFMPPLIKIHSHDSKSSKTIELINPNSVEGAIYFTVNGSDPGMKKGAIHGKRYSEMIKTKRGKKIKARFFSKSGIWSALAEK